MCSKIAQAIARCAILDREDMLRREGFLMHDYQVSHHTGDNAASVYAISVARRAEAMFKALNPAPPAPENNSWRPPPSPPVSAPSLTQQLTPRERAEAAGWTVHS